MFGPPGFWIWFKDLASTAASSIAMRPRYHPAHDRIAEQCKGHGCSEQGEVVAQPAPHRVHEDDEDDQYRAKRDRHVDQIDRAEGDVAALLTRRAHQLELLGQVTRDDAMPVKFG